MFGQMKLNATEGEERGVDPKLSSGVAVINSRREHGEHASVFMTSPVDVAEAPAVWGGLLRLSVFD